MIRLVAVGLALALAACGSDKAEAPAPDNTVVIVVPPDEGNTIEPEIRPVCKVKPWVCENEQPLQ